VILIPLENGQPYGTGLLFGSMLAKQGILVGGYKAKELPKK